MDDIIKGTLTTSIGEIANKKLFARFKFVLITSVDSTTVLSTEKTASCIRPFDSECAFLGSGVLVRGNAMAAVAKELHLFTGFDEVWCFEIAPKYPKPDDWIVSPFDANRDAPPLSLISWMKETDCRLGLGIALVSILSPLTRRLPVF